VHANGLDDEPGRDRSLFDLPETDDSDAEELAPEPQDDEGREDEGDRPLRRNEER
jgi:hypothetical protein